MNKAKPKAQASERTGGYRASKSLKPSSAFRKPVNSYRLSIPALPPSYSHLPKEDFLNAASRRTMSRPRLHKPDKRAVDFLHLPLLLNLDAGLFPPDHAASGIHAYKPETEVGHLVFNAVRRQEQRWCRSVAVREATEAGVEIVRLVRAR